ncbi:DNA cytosine methyltransferase [uncultured Selenomonas sp.]|uniref:DNA cytosine methyltransferase n=1 Tax=uncultured Selenomonas sp. TaxID=159275 RepID=UPI0025FFA0D8|nr:DNA cytosine methyltransferase [uncultured Selenomonas sp.]
MIQPLTCVEICTGAGGQALGLAMAGFVHVVLVEYEQEYVDNMKRNRPEWPIACMDVHDFSGLPYRGVDLFAGGVPCPPFSVAGKQLGKDDERDLFPEAIRLIGEIRPRAIMLENVRGFLDPVFDQYREHILSSIERLGYRVAIRLLNANDYGVSQLRPRVVIVGLRNDEPGTFLYPMPHPEKTPTVGQLLYDLMKAEGWEGAAAWAKQADRIAPTIVGGSKKHGGPDLGPTRARKAWAEMQVNGVSIADRAPEKGFVGMPRLTPRMIARIQGFPDTWTFGDKKTKACRMIGNAFPPPVAKAVGESIKEALNAHASIDFERAQRVS